MQLTITATSKGAICSIRREDGQDDENSPRPPEQRLPLKQLIKAPREPNNKLRRVLAGKVELEAKGAHQEDRGEGGAGHGWQALEAGEHAE